MKTEKNPSRRGEVESLWRWLRRTDGGGSRSRSPRSRGGGKRNRGRALGKESKRGTKAKGEDGRRGEALGRGVAYTTGQRACNNRDHSSRSPVIVAVVPTFRDHRSPPLPAGTISETPRADVGAAPVGPSPLAHSH